VRARRDVNGFISADIGNRPCDGMTVFRFFHDFRKITRRFRREL